MPIEALAGTYDVEIRVADWGNQKITSSATVHLHVNRVGDYSVGPSELMSNTEQSAVYKLPVTNNSNAPLKVHLKDALPDAPFTLSASEIEIEPSTTDSLTVTVQLKDKQSLPPGSPVDLVTEGTYGGGSEAASERTQQVTWPVPAGPALSIIRVEPDPLSLAPGQNGELTGELTVTLKNERRDTQKISLSVDHLPQGWVAPPRAFEVNPGDHHLAIEISVPKDRAQPLAGTYPLVVHVVPTDPTEEQKVPVQVDVKFDGDSETHITPETFLVQNGGQSAEFTVSVRNKSNATLQVSLLNADSAELTFALPVIEVAPSQTNQAILTVSLKEAITESRLDDIKLNLHRVFWDKDHRERVKEDHYTKDVKVQWIIPPPHPRRISILPNGNYLDPGGHLTSQNGQYRLIYQTDGNLVLYRMSDNHPLWASDTCGQPAGQCLMKSDGDLIILKPDNCQVWDSCTNVPGSYLEVQDKGLVVMYGPQGGDAVWWQPRRR